MDNIEILVDQTITQVDVLVNQSVTNVDVIVSEGATIISDGGGDFNFVHNQAVASTTWNITHNAGKYPAVTIVNTANDEMDAFVKHISMNELTITFLSSTAGKAYLN